MSIIQCLAAIQTSTNGYQGLNEYTALYITIGIAAAVFGLIAFIFIRTSARRSTSAEHRPRPKDGDHAPGGARTPS